MRGLRGLGIHGLANPVFSAGGAGGVPPWYLSGGIEPANCIAAYKAVGAANIAASYVNLANPGVYNLTAGVEPTWDTDIGWTFDGATQYLKTGISGSDYSTWTMIIRFSNTSAATGFLAGCYADSGKGFNIASNRSTNRRFMNGGDTVVSGSVTSGVLAVVGSNGYQDGVDIANITTSALGRTMTDLFIGALCHWNVSAEIASYFLAGKIQAIALYNTVLTDAQVKAVTASMQQLDDIEFSLVFLPDMQTYITESAYVTSLQNWIVNNQSTYRIGVILSAGDMTNTNEAAEWTTLDNLFDAIDVYNIPYLLTVGNHDGDGLVPTRGAMVDWNLTFPQARYTGKDWWAGDFYEAGQSQNAYLILRGEYLFITIEHGPRQVVLDWVSSVIAAHPNHKVILTSHGIEHDETEATGRFSTDGDNFDATDYYLSDAHDGDLIWSEALQAYANVILVMGGHFVVGYKQHHVATGTNGNLVECEFINYQNGVDNTIRMISFMDGGSRLWVRTYNPHTSTRDSTASGEYFVEVG